MGCNKPVNLLIACKPTVKRNSREGIVIDRFVESATVTPRLSDVTQILDRASRGDLGAAQQLLPLVYEELRRLAAHKMANEPHGHTLQPTALVHEAWLRLAREGRPGWDGRGHFF